MREGLRSGKKLASPNLGNKGLVKDTVVKIKNLEFDSENEQCSPAGGTVGKQGGRGRRGRKRKNVDVSKEADEVDCDSDAKKVADLKEVHSDDKFVADGNGGVDAPFKEGNCEFDQKNEPSLNEVPEVVVDGDGDTDMPLKEADEGNFESDEKTEAPLNKLHKGDEAVVDAEVSVGANGDVYAGVDTPTKEAEEGNCDSDEKKMVSFSEVHESDGVVVNAPSVVAYGDIDKPVKEGGEGKCESDEKKEDSLNKVHEAYEVVAGTELSVNANGDVDARVDTPRKDADEGNCQSDEKKEASLKKVHEGDEVVSSAKVNVHANVDVDKPLKDADEGNCVSDLNKDASSNKPHKGNEVVSGAEVSVNVNGDVDASIDTPSKEADCKDDEKKAASLFKLHEGDEAVDVSVNGDVDATVDTPLKEADGRKGKRGRKKKIVGCPNCSEVNDQNCENENMELPTGSFGTCRVMQEVAKGRRGRKRKIIESSECTDDDGDRKKMTKDCTGQVGRRVLRSMSGTCEEKVNAKNDEESLNLGSPIKLTSPCGRLSQVQEENLALVDDKNDTEEDEKPQCISRPKKLKGRRGRPPKVNRDNGAAGEEDSGMEKDEESLNPGSPITITSSRGRLCKVRERNLALVDDNTDTEEDEEPQRISKPKKLKGRRGRPPKVNRDNGASGEEDFVSEKDERPRNISKTKKLRGHCGRPVMKHGKSKGLRLVHRDIIKSRVQKMQGSLKVNTDNKQKVMGSEEASSQSQTTSIIRLNNSKKNGIREEKQLVRENIIRMLLEAGWTIDYRQRQGREYRDAVYVDCEKRTYWSVTLAYRKLKEKVESGKADSKAVSAFEPIPDEILSKLFRVTVKGKKSKEKGEKCNETDQVIDGEQSSKKKYSTNKGVGHKGKKSSLRAGEETSKRKKKGDKSESEQNGSSSNRRRGMSGSNRETRKDRKPCLLARSSAKVSNPESGGLILHNGKRSIWSWMIDLGTLPSSSKVKYVDRGTSKILVDGKITRDGILCGCCNNVVAISEFVSHTGTSVAHDSHIYNDIYLGPGISLSQCLWNSWSKQLEADPIRFCYAVVDGDDPNDDTCNICADGGDLICCDGCPSTFHQSCLDFEKFPSGEWRCLHCVCKFCKTIHGRVSQGDDNYKNPSGLLSCCLCQEKFHQTCTLEEDAEKINPNCPSFCGSKCQEIFERLQVLFGVKHQIEDGFSWTLLRYSDVGQDSSLISDPTKLECNAKLAVAFSIMDECFCPIFDERTGINTIHNVVYSCGSNINRLNFSGFFIIVLERGDDVTAAASIRIHGDQLAEMPFIGTRHIYRRQGMCRRLVNAIELVLCSLDVEKLVIPAISELNQTWTSVFGFNPREESTRQSMRHMSVIVFPGTDMLQKPIPKDMIAKHDLIPAAESTDLNLEHDAPDNLDMRGSDTIALQDEIIVSNVCRVNDDTVADESIVDPPDISADLASNSGSVTLQVSADKKLCLDHLSLSGNGKVDTVSAGSACSYPEHGVEQTPMNMTECSNTISDVTTVLPDKTSTHFDLDSEDKTYSCTK